MNFFKLRSSRIRLLFFIFVIIVAAGVVVFFYPRPDSKSNSNTYVFKDLGVQITLPSQLYGLTSGSEKSTNQTTSVTTTHLYLTNYTILANRCVGNSKDSQSFATLVKLPGTPPGQASGALPVLKQFNSFYIINLGSSLPTKAPCKDSLTEQQLATLSSQLNNALKQAFNSASLVTTK